MVPQLHCFQGCTESLEKMLDCKANLNKFQRLGRQFESPGNLTLRRRLGCRKFIREHSWDWHPWEGGEEAGLYRRRHLATVQYQRKP